MIRNEFKKVRVHWKKSQTRIINIGVGSDREVRVGRDHEVGVDSDHEAQGPEAQVEGQDALDHRLAHLVAEVQ